MVRTCKICGCTDHNPCFHPRYGFCWWPAFGHDICSHCLQMAIATDKNTIHCVKGMEFPVLTVHQPYALMLVAGKKPIEFRSWKLPEKYIGQRIFIHASLKEAEFYSGIVDPSTYITYSRLAEYNEYFGCIVGSVIFGKSEGPFDGSSYGVPSKTIYKWPVEQPIMLEKPLTRIPGKQGIWKIKF